MSERDLDEVIYQPLEDDTDRAHGQHILDAVAASEARRQGSAEDPLLKALDKAHRAKAEEDNQQ